MKRSYHSDVIISYQLGVLQPNILQQVPSSTLHNWKQRNLSSLIGTQQCLVNEQNIQMVKTFLRHKNALRIAKAAYLAFRLMQEFASTSKAFRKWALKNKEQFVQAIGHMGNYIPLKKALSLFKVSKQAFHQWKNQIDCQKSFTHQCLSRHSYQLHGSEIGQITKYLSDKNLLHWPLSSIFYLMLRQGKAFMSLSTFYKYASRLTIRGIVPIRAIGTKKKYSPLRAQHPMGILHMDITILKTLENQKLYLYILQDNFSRAILSWTLSAQYNATTAMHNLQKGISGYSHLIAENSTIVCDDGVENKGDVKSFILGHPLLEQAIAQKDIVQSNSMVEALNKRLKYRFLYRHHLTNEEHARKTVAQAVEDYHQQPLKALHGLTAIEVLAGSLPDKKAFSIQIGQAMAKRPQLNAQNACLDCSK